MRVKHHNANVCTESCSNGHCDGSCGWYNKEKAALDSEKAQLEENRNLLNQIRDKASSDTLQWTGKAKALLSKIDENDARIEDLQNKLADLRKRYDTCRGSIPANCAVNPHVLDDKCERMHAACGKLFDGN
jgi:DNA repair ATPase RecN